jgi:hypothetical protein
VVLSPVLNPGQFRIVLTWGAHPADLEAHLTGPNSEGCRHHCFHWNRTIPGATLDVDDRESYGPETITISQMDPGNYRFYVHDFTNRNSANSTALANSNATVTVYSGSGGVPLIYNTPDGVGTVWHVFNLDGNNGAITPIDKLTNQVQPGQIDFPRITSSPVTGATYGEPYIYQVKAEDPDTDTLTYSLLKGPDGLDIDPFGGLIQWTPTGEQGGWQDVQVQVGDGRCGKDTQAFRVHLTYLPIVDATVEPCSGFNPGGEITLTWQTERADTVVIDQGIGEVPASGSISLPSPEQPIPFTITVTNGAGTVQRTVPEAPAINSLAAECVDAPGETSLLTWAGGCAVNCFIDQRIGSVPASGSIMLTPADLPEHYTVTCSNGTGMDRRETSIVGCRSSVKLDATDDCGWTPGDSVELSWTTSRADNCVITPDIGSVPLNGSMQVYPGEDPTRYTLTCNGASSSVTISNPRTVKLAASNSRLLPGQSTGLSWATACFETCSFDQGIGDVPTTGNLTVTPHQLPTTYTLTAMYDQHTVTKPITIMPPFPEATIAASPVQIKTDETAILSWTTELATSCTIEPDIGEVPLSGSIVVSPGHNTTYWLTATGLGGSILRTATVTYVKPMAAIYADPEHLDVVGQPSTLTWVFSNADTCEIDQGIGPVEPGGSILVSPQQTTTYTITATGPGGIAKDHVTVAFTPPTVQISADRQVLDEGETATLTWSFANADTASINQGIGVVQSGGSLVVDPQRTTTYTITATGPGGTTTDQVTVTCLAPTVEIQADHGSVIEGQTAALTWQADHASTCIIEPIIGAVDSKGSIDVTPNITTTYTLTASGRGGTTSTAATLVVINPPSISLIEPGRNGDHANYSYTIRWTDKDHDSDAIISLYYDINNSGADGTLIVTGIGENADGQYDTYLWDTSGVPNGNYYVYARIEDGVNGPVIDYSPGVVAIDHAATDEIKLTAPDGAAYDYFGSTVAISGDYAVVGAPGSGDTGAAYIFKKEDTTWVEQIKLTPGDGAASENFGTWVSISGDTLAVGAPKSNANTGAAYVFTRDGSTWTQQARLIAGDGQAYDEFGACISISGDTLVVGAPNHDDYSGAAYVFTRQGSSWSEPIKLDGGGATVAGHFGNSVSISEDTLIIGSPSVGNQKGAAFIFRHAGSEWVAEAQLEPGDAVAWEYFGASVFISGDYAIVGNTGLAEANVEGAARIYAYDGTAWVEQAKITSSSVNAGESFGRSVSINSDMAAVSEPKVWNDAGAVYLFQRTGAQWNEQDPLIPGEGGGEGSPSLPGEGEREVPPIPREGEREGDPALLNGYQKLTPIDGAAEDFFGDCVALDDKHVIVGARLDDDKGHESGSAYVYPLISVSIGADPESIFLCGEGAAPASLSWTSRGVDSVQIDPDIGSVAASGSVTISPLQTTTYTITGIKGGTAITDSATVTIIDASVHTHRGYIGNA